MITYRTAPKETIVLYWENGVPHIIGRQSQEDRARIIALGQRVDGLAANGPLDPSIDPHILWAITRAYSSSEERASLPRERLIEIAWTRQLNMTPEEEEEDEPIDLPVLWVEHQWSDAVVTESIKRLKGACLLAVDRVTRTKKQGVVERFRIIFPVASEQAESQST